MDLFWMDKLDKFAYYTLLFNVSCSLVFLLMGGYEVILAPELAQLPYSNIKIGIIILCLTPFLRIFFCLVEFVLMKDWLYVGISMALLSLIWVSLCINGVLSLDFKFFIHSDFEEIDKAYEKMKN